MLERNLLSDEYIIKLFSSSYKEAPIIEIKGCSLLNTEKLGAIVHFFEEQLGQDLIAKIEFEAELY